MLYSFAQLIQYYHTLIRGGVPVDYQKIVCWGDSQTLGARTYGCYPLYLAQILNQKTRYVWHAMNFSTNGHTVRDLWLRLHYDLLKVRDVYQACILIGTNDLGNDSPPDLFDEYYRQILQALQISRFRVVYCGEILPIWPDGHAFFSAETRSRADAFNIRLREIVQESPIARLVEFPNLTADCFVDPVHLNESGNRIVADSFAEAIRRF
jgi:lysophospholipase L1-like esterase